MEERMERRDRDERIERRELQDLFERKDLIERTDAGRGCWKFCERLELSLSILPQQGHGAGFAGVLAWYILGMLTREAVLIGLATRIPSPRGRIVAEAGIDAVTEALVTRCDDNGSEDGGLLANGFDCPRLIAEEEACAD
jgi:hypothetical protein